MAKKKILLLSDDLRLTSGIATVSRDMVIGTVHKYDWVQVGAAINHPDKGKVLDLSQDAKDLTGVQDASIKIYCNDGYGDPMLIRRLIETEKPDAILHFTDPRFWDWLYSMEHEIRTKTPLMYLNIWDDIPDPMWNKEAYASCDLLMAISKQTYGINHRVLTRFGQSTPNHRITYVPHGINTDMFYPITEGNKAWEPLVQESKKIRGNNDKKFVVFWNNRNIHRKHPGDVILAYNHMCQLIDKNGGNAEDDCLLLMHTQPIDPNGTDLTSVATELCPSYPVMFSDKVLSTEALNIMYNVADVTINMASNEGFGISTIESIAAGTPIIINVTGGMQDHCGFINPSTGKYFTAEEYIQVKTLHRKDEWGHLQHGEWVKPVWPSNISLQGSVPTPYIFDDRADFRDFGNALYDWYNTPRENRTQAGLEGREYVMNPEVGMSRHDMSNRIVESIDGIFENFTPRNRYELHLA
jgi:glycosyltransferase involved in cell wall biosynthesis